MVRQLKWAAAVVFGAVLSWSAARAAEQEEPILTPPASAQPRINGPSIFGVRPGSPLLYTIPATGSRPMEFSLKYDWNPNDVPHVEQMSGALASCRRDIVYSLSNSAPFEQAADWARLANCWRTTGDIWDYNARPVRPTS